ncbi:MAG: BTAD domain-containing putative transcriptional regulator [Gemmatimonadales bacterium]
MLRLRTLGGAVVESGGAALAGTAGQRKSLALLALLAPAGDRGVSRDKVLAYLWPEAEPDRAAHRLTQLLYALRRDLKAEELFLGSNELRLNPELLTSDVQEFSTARRVGELERAVSLYGGPFLDGFFLSGASEFERWVENERTGLAGDYAEALETLAADAAAQGNPRRAAQWWRRLAEQDPLSSRVTVHLMSALAAAGSRAAALDQAREYEALVRDELGAVPNPAVLALAAQLRQRPREPPVGQQAAPPSTVFVAVLPFANLSAVQTNDFFVEGLADELAAALARLDGVRVAARTSAQAFRGGDLDAREIGRRLGVHALIEGSVRQAGGRVRVTAQLVATSDGCRVWSERYEREVADVFAVQDELTGAIVSGAQGPLLSLSPR